MSPLTKEELKAYQTFGVLQSVHIRMGQGSKNEFLNYLLKLPWLFDGSVRNAFPSHSVV